MQRRFANLVIREDELTSEAERDWLFGQGAEHGQSEAEATGG